MAKTLMTIESKSIKPKIAGLIRSKSTPYVRHTEQYAKKNVEKMRKDIKSITGMTEDEYKVWMKDQLKIRKGMKMNWSDYDLYLQSKIAKAVAVSTRIEKRRESGQYLDDRMYKTIDEKGFKFGRKSVFTPEVTKRAFFSLPTTYEKGIEKSGVENYSQYILLREMRSGLQADTMVYRHAVTTYTEKGLNITPIRQTETIETTVIMTKSSVYRENYYKSLYASMIGHSNGLNLFNELITELNKLDDFEFESVASFINIEYIYEEGEAREQHMRLYNDIKDEIDRINKKKAKK